MIMYGSGGVGKSQLTIRFVTGDFFDDYDPTIEDYYRKLIDVNGQPAYLDILDTAGREEFSAMLDQFFRMGRIFFLVFSITSRDSWDHAALYRKRLLISRDGDMDYGLVLIANKVDLEEFRQVSREEILEKAMEWNVPVIETSAKANVNVEHMFHQGIYAAWVNSQAHCVNQEI